MGIDNAFLLVNTQNSVYILKDQADLTCEFLLIIYLPDFIPLAIFTQNIAIFYILFTITLIFIILN